MKFAILKEHRDFFNKQGTIEFEGFLSRDQLATINHAIDEALSERSNVPIHRLRQFNSEQLFSQGRDLWRVNAEVRKLACQLRFAEVASELVERKPIRLGYDQLFPARHHSPVQTQDQIYGQFLDQPAALNQVSCLQGILCGLMICLSDTSYPEEQPTHEGEGLKIFPSTPGHVIFFRPDMPIDFSSLYRHAGQRFYLIVYTQAIAQYYLQPNDPHTYALKHLGYVFYDRLSDKWNPIVYR